MTAISIERPIVQCKISNIFIAPETFTQPPAQYFNFYNTLNQNLRPALEKVMRKHDKNMKIIKDLTVVPDHGSFGLVGVVFKEMSLRPCVLDQYFKKKRGKPKDGCYADENDVLYLEDKEGRMEIYGALKTTEFVTGQFIGILGKKVKNAVEVEKVFFPERPMQIKRNLKKGPEHFVCFVSGLRFGDPSVSTLSRELLFDFLSGFATNGKESSKVVRVVIAGSSFALTDVGEMECDNISKKRTDIPVANVMRELDTYLSQLAATMPVDIMPGESDPSGFFFTSTTNA